MFKIKLDGGKTMEVEERTYWHTTSHILAQAVKRLYPKTKLTIGPAIENGFYYDFDLGDETFTPEMLENLEEEIEIIVNIEIQNNDKPGYPIPKRGIYYGARIVSSQRGTLFRDQEYGKIKKVVSIWICENTAVSRSDSINEYLFSEKCRRGTYQEEKENYDLIRVIVMRLGAEGEHSEDDAIRLLSSMFSPTRTAEDKKKILSEEFHISVTEEINREVRRMCNLSAGILEKGIEEGTLKTLFRLVKKGLISITAAAQEANMEPAAFEEKYKSFYK